ncbi:MAG: L-lactate permease [Chloroflexi bacterium]|nr:MAG: L-lactate permease [Chloroflexota bacterium]TMF89102.1 MAG: L-lactate permease [Chloroflexota bacterium]TMG13054.1 MAG: L-lactate permease [Chloroflexota bacterium]
MGVLLAFHQVYQPVVDSILLSALVAGLPLYVLFVLLAILRLPAWICALAAMLTAFVLGWLVWGMPFGISVGTATEGMAFGLWPISWIVLNAVFFHNLTVASGDFDVIKRSLTRLTTDRRLQVLLVAFSFGALLEGIAGFGAPVAITASILASLGFEPVTAAVLALLANTAPVAFGSIGIPVVTLGGLVAPIIGHPVTNTTLALSAMVGRQLPLFSILIPAYLIVVLAGFRRMTEILPAVLVTGVSFAVVQFLVSNFVGPELTDIIAALVSMGCLALLLRVWRPRDTWQFEGEPATAVPSAEPRRVMGGSDLPARGVADTPDTRASRDVIDSPSRIARAYAMYLVLVIVILIGQMGNLPWWSGHPVGDVKTALPAPANITADLKCGTPAFALCKLPWIGPDPAKDRQAFKFPDWNFLWPGTYDIQKGQPVSLINREKPIVSKSTPYPLAFDWNFLAAAGSLVLYACIVAFLLMLLAGARLNFFTVYARTIRQLALPIATIALILAIAQLMNYSGMTASMAIALSKTGFIFPFVAAFLGWLGVFLTGSDTSSNTLFGPLQAQTAQQLGNVSPILTAGTNSSGGVMGKMISPQNLSVGAAGVNKVGAEGDIFRRVIGYSLILTSAVGIVAMIEAYVIPGIVPTP